MHIHALEDSAGDIIDIVYFCSDYCHKTWCGDDANPDYAGWDGCHETDYTVECACCGWDGVEYD